MSKGRGVAPAYVVFSLVSLYGVTSISNTDSASINPTQYQLDRFPAWLLVEVRREFFFSGSHSSKINGIQSKIGYGWASMAHIWNWTNLRKPLNTAQPSIHSLSSFLVLILGRLQFCSIDMKYSFTAGKKSVMEYGI